MLTAPREQGGHGWRGIVVTSRGCANAPLRTPKLYHCGATYDLKTSMLYIAHKFPNAPVYGIGFSLGAGMLTRYLGTEGGGSQMKAGIAVGAPWDLMMCVLFQSRCCQRLSRIALVDTSTFKHRSWAVGPPHIPILHLRLTFLLRKVIYSKAMAKNLQYAVPDSNLAGSVLISYFRRRIFTKHINVFKQHPKIDISAVRDNPNMTLYEFDSLVTRVCGGFVIHKSSLR